MTASRLSWTHGPAGHVDPVEKDMAGVGLDHAAGHAEAGGFARPVRPEQPDDFAAIHLEIDAVDDAAGTVDLHQSVDFEHRHPWRLLAFAGRVPKTLR
jgi:hypothetical protein